MRFLIKRTTQGSDFATYTPPHPDAEPVVCHPSDEDRRDGVAPIIYVVTTYTTGALTALADKLVVGTLAHGPASIYLDDRTIENTPALDWLEREGITHFVEIYDGYRE